MTPFGQRVRQLRQIKGVTQKEMAAALGVSPAYLSALENGKRGSPTWDYVQRVINYFNVIWDDAEELQYLAITSNPRVMVDTSNLSAEATEFANYVARNIDRLNRDDLEQLTLETKRRVERNR